MTDAREAVQSLRARLASRVEWWQQTLPGHSVRRAQDLGLVTQTLALAAQQVLCTAPLLVALSAVARRVSDEDVGTLFTRYLGLTGAAARDVSALFSGASPSVPLSDLIVGVVATIIFGTGVAATQQRGYEMIWSQTHRGLRATGRQMVWALGLVVYLLLVLGVGRGAHHLHSHHHERFAVRLVVQLVVSFWFFLWSQHLLLSARVSWRDLVPGAWLMAGATALLVALSGVILPGQITEQVKDYGLVGAAFVLSLWFIILSSVIFGGSLLGALLVERRQGSAASS